ncbi:hypothetical protein [Halalkalicoccus jeotgali]|uniref:Uncharacterized protein n=1 Tax=Halalkalicoccus jeotgali (strain DSM 18796 / CECT 7217 / JCM 14584 / KCTC 4019 / B3) TaxID=795797 RepID=D8J618_HALJB|nr:hypothetical protein [Halalkalicoccus jeotgali]ADJ13824.1 hypothetical protein HacjB3_02155 [Halalkalicoccus jeotgali B3]ELY34130.1 hypothetical protein C497_17162 [Halalkalicoccus jeotgali B3]
MYVSNVTRRNGSLSSITVADPDGRSASFAVERGESGVTLAHTPRISEAWRREAWAYANVMLATELETSAGSATA